MRKTLSIRWHSRAGQGAITASTALADILGKSGKYVQSFPDFGAEKRGAPVTVFNRICSSKIEDVSHPTEVDAVVLLDTTLISSCEIPISKLFEGLKPDGIILINTIQKKLHLSEKPGKIFTLNASQIAEETIGRDIPNVPILGALIRVLELSKLNEFSKELKEYLSGGLPPAIVEGNIRAFELGFNEVSEATGSQNGLPKACAKAPDWKKMPLGAAVKKPGSSEKYDTGNWVRKTCRWNAESCINCNLCWPVCPHDAITNDAQGNMTGVDEKKCTACGLCVAACPTNPKSLGIANKKTKEI